MHRVHLTSARADLVISRDKGTLLGSDDACMGGCYKMPHDCDGGAKGVCRIPRGLCARGGSMGAWGLVLGSNEKEGAPRGQRGSEQGAGRAREGRAASVGRLVQKQDRWMRRERLGSDWAGHAKCTGQRGENGGAVRCWVGQKNMDCCARVVLSSGPVWASRFQHSSALDVAAEGGKAVGGPWALLEARAAEHSAPLRLGGLGSLGSLLARVALAIAVGGGCVVAAACAQGGGWTQGDVKRLRA